MRRRPSYKKQLGSHIRTSEGNTDETTSRLDRLPVAGTEHSRTHAHTHTRTHYLPLYFGVIRALVVLWFCRFVVCSIAPESSSGGRRRSALTRKSTLAQQYGLFTDVFRFVYGFLNFIAASLARECRRGLFKFSIINDIIINYLSHLTFQKYFQFFWR